MTRTTLAVVFVCAICTLDGRRPAGLASQPVLIANSVQIAATPPPELGEAGIRRKLDEIVPHIQWEEIQLWQAIAWLQNVADLPITVRWEALATAGINRGMRVTLHAERIRVRSILREVLNQVGSTNVDLRFAVVDGILIVSFAEDIAQYRSVRVFDVSDFNTGPWLKRRLRQPRVPLSQPTTDQAAMAAEHFNEVLLRHGMAELVDAVQLAMGCHEVHRDDCSAPSVCVVGDRLVVRHSVFMLDTVESVLRALRDARSAPSLRRDPSPAPPSGQTWFNATPDYPCDIALEGPLREVMNRIVPAVRLTNIPLKEAIKTLVGDQINMVVDWPSLVAADVEPNKQLTLHLDNVPLHAALQKLLDVADPYRAGLGFHICGDLLSVTTEERLGWYRFTRVYDIADLLSAGRRMRAQLAATPNATDDEFHAIPDSNKIMDVITQTIEPESWRWAGGNTGDIASCGEVLIIAQAASAHRRIEELLNAMRAAGGIMQLP